MIDILLLVAEIAIYFVLAWLVVAVIVVVVTIKRNTPKGTLSRLMFSPVRKIWRR